MIFNIEQIENLLETKLDILTEDQLQFLVENRVEFIKNANKDKIQPTHDPESAKLSSDQIVDHIASKIDPTKNKAHTQWLVNRYKAGDFKLGDHKPLKKLMDSYESAKSVLENKDLNSIKSISHLRDHIAPVQSKLKSIATEDSGGTEMPVVFNEDGATGYKIPSKKASIENYGPAGKMAKTKWCTAANSSFNMFNGYAGGKYTLHLPNREVIQLHHQSNQIMDTDDRKVDMKNDQRFAPHRETINKFLLRTHELEGHPESNILPPVQANPSDLDHAIGEHMQHVEDLKSAVATGKSTYDVLNRISDSSSNIENIVAKSRLTDAQFGTLKSLPSIASRYSDVLTQVDHTHSNAKSLFARPDHLKHIASSESSSIDDITHAVKNDNATSEVTHAAIDRILNPKTTDYERDQIVHKLVLNATNLTPEHLSRIEHLHGVKHIVFDNSHAVIPEHYFETADNVSFASHPNIPHHVAQRTVESSDHSAILRGLTSNPSVHKDIALKALQKNKGDNALDFINRADVTPDAVSEAVRTAAMHGMHGAWTNSSKLSRSDVQHVLNHPLVHKFVSVYGNSITQNHRTKSEDLDALVDHPLYNDDFARAIAKSPVAKPKTISKVLARVSNTSTLNQIIESANDSFQSEHLHLILDHPSATMQQKHKVLMHDSVQLSHFDKLKDNNRFHGAISNSKNAPPSILHSLATSPMDHVRLNVAGNPNTEKRTLDILKSDPNKEIATLATKKAK